MVKDIKRLNKRIAALSHFVARAIDKCHIFLKAVKIEKNLKREGISSAESIYGPSTIVVKAQGR